MKNKIFYNFYYMLIIILVFACFELITKEPQEEITYYESSNIPDYSGEDVIIINNNEPDFVIDFDKSESFEKYGDLDKLGRCTSAISNIGYDLMPTTPRESIRDIRPSGFRVARYDIITDGLYLFNRCHLIAYSLSGENDNVNNLITCTRYLNSISMLEFEEKVANYIRRTNNHVLYRVKPIFDKTNLIAKGVQM